MKKVLLPLTILFCCAFNNLAQGQVEPEEYEVYKVLLGDGSQLAVSRFTVYGKLTSYHKRELSVVESETRKSYKLRNQNSSELQNNFDISPKVRLVGGEDVIPFFEKAKENELVAQNAFYEKFGSRSLISLSRVGFNKAKNQALVNVTSNTGLCGTCSESYFFVLSKERKSWVIKKKLLAWIS